MLSSFCFPLNVLVKKQMESSRVLLCPCWGKGSLLFSQSLVRPEELQICGLGVHLCSCFLLMHESASNVKQLCHPSFFSAPSSLLSLVPYGRLVSVKLEYIALRVSGKDSFTASTVIVGLAQHEFCHMTCPRTAAEHRSSHGKPTTCSPIQSRLCVDTGGTYLEKNAWQSPPSVANVPNF